MVWTPSAMKKVAPISSSVSMRSMAAPALFAASPKNRCAIPARPGDHGERQCGYQNDAKQDRDKAGTPDRAGIVAADGVSDTHRRRHADAERHHEQDGGDLQRDLVRGERGGADQPHQQRRGAEQAILQQERDRDRRADDDELAHQAPVDAPDAAEHVIFPERPAAGDEPQAGQERADIDDGGAKPRAEQLQPRQAPRAVDQQIDQHARWPGSRPA